jgi:hypothetical protein
MKIRITKNICSAFAFMSVVLGVCNQPQLIKWLLSLFIIYMVCLWLGHDENE